MESNFLGVARIQRAVLSQLPLALTTAVAVVFLLLIDPVLVWDRSFAAGVAGVAVLTAAAALVPWARLPGWCLWLIPLLDFIPIGAMVHGANTTLTGLSLLSVFPVLWLAWSDIPHRAARAAALLGPLTIAWAPFIFANAQPSRAGMIRPLLIPLIMVALATAATVVNRSMRLQSARLAATYAIAQRRAGQLDTILNVADVGVVVVDEGGNDVLMNKRQQLNHALAIPQGVPDPAEADLLVFAADRSTPAEPQRRPVRRAVDGEEFSGELYWLGSGGGQRAMATSARQIVDAKGVRQGAVVVFHDVTEVMVAVAAQEDFVASVSHELRTPLTSILGYLELAMDEEVAGPVPGYLKVMSRNAERLLALVNDLLGSASDGTAIMPLEGDLHSVLASAVEAARPRARSKGVELVLDAAPGLRGRFDRVRIGQAVDNLISNAVKFSDPSGTVEVRGRMGDSGLQVSVRDHGAGMSQEEQAGLFNRFYRTTSARRAAIPGAGLGLAITKAIVDAHGGSLTVDSAPGQGSTFTITVPGSARQQQ